MLLILSKNGYKYNYFIQLSIEMNEAKIIHYIATCLWRNAGHICTFADYSRSSFWWGIWILAKGFGKVNSSIKKNLLENRAGWSKIWFQPLIDFSLTFFTIVSIIIFLHKQEGKWLEHKPIFCVSFCELLMVLDRWTITFCVSVGSLTNCHELNLAVAEVTWHH